MKAKKVHVYEILKVYGCFITFTNRLHFEFKLVHFKIIYLYLNHVLALCKCINTFT